MLIVANHITAKFPPLKTLQSLADLYIVGGAGLTDLQSILSSVQSLQGLVVGGTGDPEILKRTIIELVSVVGTLPRLRSVGVIGSKWPMPAGIEWHLAVLNNTLRSQGGSLDWLGD